jgi:serine/threonine-protein kinase
LPPTSLAVAAVGVWALVATIGSTTIAWIIYGLREHVRAAMELGQYTLLEKIGEGGMGVVFKARHTLLRRPTAVKILRAEGARETSFARFEREVQLTSEISHPNVVSVYDFGRSADGDFYYAMEYLDGIDLERLVEQYGRQPAARVVHVMRQAADALAEAHAVGLIHRDVKPANMILCDHPRRPDLLKVVDFGLVKDLSSRDPVLSDENVLTGTPLYMAPEAISAPEQLDARGDIYALGAVGYFLLTGTPPFSGRTVIEVLGQHLHGTVIPPSAREGVDVPHDLETLILSCLAKSPAERPQSAAAVVAALRNCGDIAAWDHVDARAWWAEREATPRKTSDHREAMTRTLAVMPRTALEHTTPANERALGR